MEQDILILIVLVLATVLISPLYLIMLIWQGDRTMTVKDSFNMALVILRGKPRDNLDKPKVDVLELMDSKDMLARVSGLVTCNVELDEFIDDLNEVLKNGSNQRILEFVAEFNSELKVLAKYSELHYQVSYDAEEEAQEVLLASIRNKIASREALADKELLDEVRSLLPSVTGNDLKNENTY